MEIRWSSRGFIGWHSDETFGDRSKEHIGTKTAGRCSSDAVLFPRNLYSVEIFEANFKGSKGDDHHLDVVPTMEGTHRFEGMARCQSGCDEETKGRRGER